MKDTFRAARPNGAGHSSNAQSGTTTTGAPKRNAWRDLEFDTKLAIWLLVCGVLLLGLHLALERPARQTATLAIRLFRQAPPIKDDLALEAAILEALARENRYDALSEGTLHLGFACLVSVAVIIMVDSVSKRKFRIEAKRSRDEIAQDVWKAVFERDIPVDIVNEVRNMLSAKVVKKKCRYTITLLPPYKGMSAGSFVIRRDLAYDLHNISQEIFDHKITSITTKNLTLAGVDQDGKPITLPRFIGLKVDGVPQNTDSKGDTAGSVVLQADEFIFKGLQPNQTPPPLIEVSGEEPYMVEALEAAFSQLTQLVGLSVTVINQYPDKIEKVGVRFHHAHWDQLVEAPTGTFSYPGGVLPGQGFNVIWRVRQPPVSVASQGPVGLNGTPSDKQQREAQRQD